MKRITSFILIMTISVSVFTASNAQSKDSVSNAIVWGISGSVDATQVNLNSLNESLSKIGIAPLNAKLIFPLMLSIYMGSVSTSVPLSFSMGFGAGQEIQQNDQYASKMTMDIWDASFHYHFWHSKRSILTAGLGFGYSGYKLHLYNISETPSSFDEALSNMQGERILKTNNNDFINPSISYKWAIYPDQSWFIGIHAGYRIGVNRKHWQLKSGVGLDGASTTSANSFYAGIDIFVQ